MIALDDLADTEAFLAREGVTRAQWDNRMTRPEWDEVREWRSILTAERQDTAYWLDEAVTAEAQDDPDEAAFCLGKALEADNAAEIAAMYLTALLSRRTRLPNTAKLNTAKPMREERTQADFRLACAR